MRSDEYRAAIITMIANGSRAIRTLVRIFRFASRPMSAVPIDAASGIRQKEGIARSLLRKVGERKLPDFLVHRKAQRDQYGTLAGHRKPLSCVGSAQVGLRRLASTMASS